MQRYHLIIKNVFTTRIMQDTDMFEPFKFVGIVQDINLKGKAITSKTLLKKLRATQQAKKEDRLEIIGVIKPNDSMAIIPNHTVLSDGTHWGLVEDIAKAYGVKQSFVVQENT